MWSPWSEVKRTIVSLSSPVARTAATSVPTLSSMHETMPMYHVRGGSRRARTSAGELRPALLLCFNTYLRVDNVEDGRLWAGLVAAPQPLRASCVAAWLLLGMKGSCEAAIIL